jgi:hypothetical protein
MSVRMPYRAPADVTIDFPAYVKTTRCEHVSRTRFFDSAHGRVRFVTYQWTDHGRVMDVWRARKAEAAEQTTADRSLPLLAQRAEPRPRPRVHASARPGRYSAGRRTS